MSLYAFLRRVLVFLCLPVLVLACAQKYYYVYVNDIELQQKWLPFLEDGKTTKEEVESKLDRLFYPYDERGVHYTTAIKYEEGRIWAYKLLLTTEGPLVVNFPGDYHLVLVFDEKNILKRHSFLRVKP